MILFKKIIFIYYNGLSLESFVKNKTLGFNTQYPFQFFYPRQALGLNQVPKFKSYAPESPSVKSCVERN